MATDDSYLKPLSPNQRTQRLLSFIPVGAALLFFVGWLSIESFYRHFGVSASDAGLGTTEAIRVAGVQVGVLLFSGGVGYLTFRVVIRYDAPPPDHPEGLSKVKAAPVGNWIFAVLLILPWLAILSGRLAIRRRLQRCAHLADGDRTCDRDRRRPLDTHGHGPHERATDGQCRHSPGTACERRSAGRHSRTGCRGPSEREAADAWLAVGTSMGRASPVRRSQYGPGD